MYVSRAHKSRSFHCTHRGIEHVHNIPPQQVIRCFSSCAAQESNAAQGCMSGRWLKTVRVNRSDIIKYSLVKLTSARFLPRKGNSTRYPPSNGAGTPIAVWMSCYSGGYYIYRLQNGKLAHIARYVVFSEESPNWAPRVAILRQVEIMRLRFNDNRGTHMYGRNM